MLDRVPDLGPVMDTYRTDDARALLLLLMVTARDGGGVRREADKVLVAATRWLRLHPDDALVDEARKALRKEFPVSL